MESLQHSEQMTDCVRAPGWSQKGTQDRVCSAGESTVADPSLRALLARSGDQVVLVSRPELINRQSAAAQVGLQYDPNLDPDVSAPNFIRFVPHSEQVPFVARRPFFSTTGSGSIISCFFLHFMQ